MNIKPLLGVCGETWGRWVLRQPLSSSSGSSAETIIEPLISPSVLSLGRYSGLIEWEVGSHQPSYNGEE
jgi:hypothetical protein